MQVTEGMKNGINHLSENNLGTGLTGGNHRYGVR
jgi:hypothetical protein